MPTVNGLDIALIVGAGFAAFGGYHLGLVTRAVSWALLAIGVLVGLFVVPSVLRPFLHASSGGEKFFAVVGLVAAFAFVGQALGLLIGSRLSARVHTAKGRQRDQRAGAMVGIIGTVIAVWILAPVMVAVPGRTASAARGSAIMRTVAQVFPPAPDLTRELRDLVRAQSPPVFASVHRTASAGPVPKTSGLSPGLERRVAASIVRIEGDACAVVQEGTGFVVVRDRVTTNAHVVAGEDQISVITADGRRRDATLVYFDPVLDVAELHVRNLNVEPLDVATAHPGEVGGVFGHPGGGDLQISPFQIHSQLRAQGRDIYDRATVRRDILVLASNLEPGDSGSPLVNAHGQVIGMAFGVAPDRDDVAYALGRPLFTGLAASSKPVDAGRCMG